MLKKILISILIVTLLTPCAFAFRVEGYSWGESRDSVVGKLGDRGWKIRDLKTQQLIEADAFLLEDECTVQFIFNKSLRLHKIKVIWNTARMGDQVRETVRKRYGNPHKAAAYNKHYEWRGSFQGEEIILDYFRDPEALKDQTVLIFNGGRDYE